MKKLLTAVLFAASFAAAQTATFTFGSLPSPFSTNQSRCASMTSWNGIPATDPNNPFPLNMGDICLDIYPAVYTDIEVPFQLGFPNNGFLQQCSPTVWQPKVDNGDGTATQTFTASGCYDGVNTTITATVNFKSVSQTLCGRFGCHKFTQWQVVSGSGTVTNL